MRSSVQLGCWQLGNHRKTPVSVLHLKSRTVILSRGAVRGWIAGQQGNGGSRYARFWAEGLLLPIVSESQRLSGTVHRFRPSEEVCSSTSSPASMRFSPSSFLSPSPSS